MWKGRKVLVAGGNGFIGGFVVEQLLELGAAVSTTSSSEAGRYRFLESVKDDIETHVGDLSDPQVARRCLRGKDLLLSLAARVGGIEYNRSHPASLFRDNIRPFVSLLEAARDEGVGRVLVTSSACVYPRDCSIPTPEEEGFRGVPEPTNAGYGWAKRMEEYLAGAYAEEFGMDIVVARPFNAYGPRDDFSPETSHVIPALIRKVESGQSPLVVWGDGSASRSFLYVEDCARGILHVAEKADTPDAINLGADDEITIAKLATEIIRVSGHDVECVFDTTKPNGQPRRSCDTRRAREILGFTARVGLEEGLGRAIDYYRSLA